MKEKIGEKFLPIGTVVMLKNGQKRVMITGFCAIDQNYRAKVWDYAGCMYPEGFLSSSQTLLFDHSQIKEIYHLGLKDDKEEETFKKALKQIANSPILKNSTTKSKTTVKKDKKSTKKSATKSQTKKKAKVPTKTKTKTQTKKKSKSDKKDDKER